MTRSIGSAIVAELDDIYRNSIENLREAMRAYARDGSVPPAEAKTDRRFCYPELRIVHHGESEAPPPGRSFARMSRPGGSVTNLTRPPIFGPYLATQGYRRGVTEGGSKCRCRWVQTHTNTPILTRYQYINNNT